MRFVNPLAGTKYEQAWGPGGGTHAYGQNWQSSWAWDLLHSSDPHPVYAPVSGVVKSVGQGGAGRFAGAKVGIEGDDGYSVFLTHLSEANVAYGQRVEAGDIVGKTGQANGVFHLHIGMARGPYSSPESAGVDPRPFLEGSAKFLGTGPNGYPLFVGVDPHPADTRTLKQRLMDAGFGEKSAEAVPALLAKHKRAGLPEAPPLPRDSKLFRGLRAAGIGPDNARRIVKALRPWKKEKV